MAGDGRRVSFMWILWKLWIKSGMSFRKLKNSRETLKNRGNCKKAVIIKYPQIFRSSALQKICGYVEKLNAKKIFADFMDISGPHSYQQITCCAIFQKKVFNLIKRRKIMTVASERNDLTLQIPRGDS